MLFGIVTRSVANHYLQIAIVNKNNVRKYHQIIKVNKITKAVPTLIFVVAFVVL